MKSVLIAEDNRSLADMYAGWLEDEYSVTTVDDGAEVLDVFDDRVDILLLDRRMPTPGDEVVSALRSRGVTVPVIIITAVEPDADIVDLPFDEYLVKPVSQSQLRGTVESVMAKQKSEAHNEMLDALGSERSRQILLALQFGPRTASEIQEVVGFSLPTIYRRLNDLQQVGLVTDSPRVQAPGNQTREFHVVASAIKIVIESGFPVDIHRIDDEEYA